MKKVFFTMLLILAVFSSKVFGADNEVFVLGFDQSKNLYVQSNSSSELITMTPVKAGMFQQYIGGPVKNGTSFICADYLPPLDKNFPGYCAVTFRDKKGDLQGNHSFTVNGNERKVFLFYSTVDIYNEPTMPVEEFKKSGLMRKGIQKLLQNAIKQYAGTEWEAVLTAELEEWK